MNTAEMAVLSVFWQKNGLRTLGVKDLLMTYNCNLILCGLKNTYIEEF